MKRLFIIVSIVLFILLPSGCAQKADGERDFGFRLSYGVLAKNKLDTFKGTFTKDLVSAGTKTVNLSLTDKEMKEIYDKFVEIDILNYPQNFKEYFYMTPSSKYILEVEIGGKVKKIELESGNIPVKGIGVGADDTEFIETEETEDILKLYRLTDKIIKMIEEKQEYKDMPKAEGGYI